MRPNLASARAVLFAITLLSASGCGRGSGGKLAATGSGDLSNPPALRTTGEPLFQAECGPRGLTAVGVRALERRPYLQQVTSNSARILFTGLPEAQNASLRLTTPAGDEVAQISAQLDTSATSGRQQTAELEGLEPATTYCYRLDGLTAPIGFRTAPLSSTGAPVRFVVLGDSGEGGDGQEAVRDQMATVAFDLMLHTGDIAYGSGTLAQLESNFFDVYDDFLESVPVFPASGNHDYQSERAAPYQEVFALPENGAPDGLERWYSFDWGEVHFVALDTEAVNDAQVRWLEQDLAHNALPLTVAYMHRPAYSSGYHGSDKKVRAAFSPLFEKYGVQVVFSGHDHDYERTRPISGVTYIVTGGGGTETRHVKRSSFTAYSEDVLHFVYGELRDHVLVLHAIDGVGREFDSVRIDPSAVLPAAQAG